MPRAPSTGFLMRADGQLRAVIPDPYDKSIDGRSARYIVTDASVLLVPCGCGAEVGKPCLSRSGHALASTHADRRDEAKRWKRRWRKTWTELVSRAAVSVRLSLAMLKGIDRPCPACEGTTTRLNQSGYREPCENCNETGTEPEDEDEPECPSERCPQERRLSCKG